MGREGNVTAIEDGGEVIFEGANRAFGWVCMVVIRVSKLVLHSIGCDGSLQFLGYLVVKTVEDWSDASGREPVMASCIAREEVSSVATLDRLNKDCV